MNKIFLIIRREYTTRVRKRSFIVMSILGPVLFAAMFVIPIWISTRESDEVKKIAVIDGSMQFINKIPETKYLKFEYITGISVENFKKILKNSKEYDALLYIPSIVASSPSSVQLISNSQPNYNITSHISSSLEKELESMKLQKYGIENLDKILESVKTKISIQTITLSDKGEKQSDVEVNMVLGYILGLLIYMFIFMFGAQVMRSVIEEKINRIVEIIISSVKPFQLMMGKVIGIALVVLTQITFWVIMTMALVTISKAVLFPNMQMSSAQPAPQSIMSPASNMSMSPGSNMPMSQTTSVGNFSDAQKAFAKIQAINFVKIIGWFVFFFIGGYLLYGSFFAAIGAVVDTETDTQQFMLPITIPLILGLFVMFYTLNNHDSSIAFWFSMIPFTSPIVMMARIPFDAPNSQIFLSAGILIATFIGSIWLSGKIYRTGILLYGKKVSYKEIYKWLRYKN
jgi:ABC-2 type transport system permease protein